MQLTNYDKQRLCDHFNHQAKEEYERTKDYTILQKLIDIIINKLKKFRDRNKWDEMY